MVNLNSKIYRCFFIVSNKNEGTEVTLYRICNCLVVYYLMKIPLSFQTR